MNVYKHCPGKLPLEGIDCFLANDTFYMNHAVLSHIILQEDLVHKKPVNQQFSTNPLTAN